MQRVYTLTDITVYIRCITHIAFLIGKFQMPVIFSIFFRGLFDVAFHKTCER